MSRPVRNKRLFGQTGPEVGNPSTITKDQQGLFFSENSPLSEEEQDELADEIRSGKVTIEDE